MKSHKEKFGHRLKGKVIASWSREYGGDNALLVSIRVIKCQICGQTEVRTVRYT